MVYITQGASNTLVFTLTEKCTLDDPEFLFVFESDETHNTYEFIGQDNSDYPLRYNRFTIVERENPNKLLGQVHLPIAGLYHYTVYEQASDSNLDPANATGIVEIGKAKVVGTEESNASYIPQENTNKVYTPQ